MTLEENLKPYKKVELEYEKFINLFFKSFENSTSRPEILNSYNLYLEDFQKEISPNFVQWIDGSFISNKENPNDIDFVTLIDFDIFEEKEQLIESKFRLHGAKKHYTRIDAYTVKMYPENHDRAIISNFDLVYWQNWFTETKKNKAKKKYPKGFIEIKFGNKK